MPANLFNCSSINEEMSASFYIIGPVPTDPILNITTCYVGIKLKILQTAAFQLTSNQASLREVLMEGFHVTYNSNCISQPCTKQPGIKTPSFQLSNFDLWLMGFGGQVLQYRYALSFINLTCAALKWTLLCLVRQ